jgi:hypothetical protein
MDEELKNNADYKKEVTGSELNSKPVSDLKKTTAEPSLVFFDVFIPIIVVSALNMFNPIVVLDYILIIIIHFWVRKILHNFVLSSLLKIIIIYGILFLVIFIFNNIIMSLI